VSTPYHFELVCANAGQFGFGGDMAFTTLSSAGASHIVIGKRKEIVSKKGVVKFRLNCTSTVACIGRLALKTPGGTKLANAKSYSIAAGGSKLISVKLTKKGLKRLKKQKHHRLKARASATDNDGANAKRAVTLILHK
jgi:hypothetical protein